MTNYSTKDKRFYMIVIPAVIVLAFIIYSHTFSYPFVFDDITNIVKKKEIRNVSQFFTVPGSRYMGYLSFALNYHFGGLNTSGYRIVNILIHSINSILIFIFVSQTFITPSMKEIKANESAFKLFFIPFAAALIFVSHPVHTQAVTYIVQRLASLTTLFYLLALIFYVKGRLCFYNQQSIAFVSRQSAWHYFFTFKHLIFYFSSLFFIVLSMRTKEISFTIPFIIVLYEVIFFDAMKNRRHHLFYLLPFLMTVFIIPFGKIDSLNALKVTFSRWTYLFTQFRVIITYLRLLIFPINQNLDYEYPLYNSFFSVDVTLSFFFLISVIGVIFKKYLLQSRDPLEKFIFFGVLWFFITISIESSFIPIVDVIFEHRLYLPSIGLIMAATSFLYYKVRYLEKGKAFILYSMVIFLIICFSAVSFKRNYIWKSEIILWKDTVKKSPYKARPIYNLGYAYSKTGDYKNALASYNTTISIDPFHSKAYNNRGNTYELLGNYEQAINDLTAAIKINRNENNAYNNRGIAYRKLGKYEEAINDFNAAIDMNPLEASPYNNRGIAYRKLGKYEEAINDFNAAIKRDPDLAMPHNNRGNIYFNLGRYKKAIASYDMAIKKNPILAIAYHNRGLSFINLKNFKQAIKNINKAISLKPDYASAYYNMGEIYTKVGNSKKAKEFYTKAKRLGFK